MQRGHVRGLFAAFLSLLVASFVLADEKPCTVHDNGKFYDLNPLKSRTDYQIVTKSGRKLSLNVCQSVKTETFGLKDGIDASQMGGFIRLDHGDYSIGKFNTSLNVFDSRPRFVMSDGSRCKTPGSGQTGDIRASTIVEFICDPSVPGFGNPHLLAALPPGDEETACAYVIDWKTSYACPTYENGGFWRFISNLIVTALILSMAYTILGSLYNRFVLDLRGYDQIPQFSLESMKYHVKEGFEWTRDMAGILYVNFFHHQSSINNNPRTPNPISHHAQVISGMGSSTNQDQDLERQRPADRTTTTTTTTASESFAKRTHANHMMPPPRPLTNPVSHHTQTLARSPPRPHHHPSTPARSSTSIPRGGGVAGAGAGTASSVGSTDREFILVDDEDVLQSPEAEARPSPPPPPPPEKTDGDDDDDAPSRSSELSLLDSDPQVPS